MKDLDLKGGEIFAIPLFIPYGTDMKRFSKKFHKEQDGDYAFCRIISVEDGDSPIIEVFSKIGRLNNSLDDILQSSRLFRPVAITGLGISKKRWLEVYKQEDYDKERDSNYSDIKLVMGAIGDFKLCQNHTVTPISDKEAKKYEEYRFWSASHLERRIREALGMDEPSDHLE